ncbi:MAG: hypothetical protein FJ151_04790 [Euryarchaeota archaeon]|nr:hypothetical protein [Euryarchaeota archaeon]
MTILSIAEIGKRLVKAGRLETRAVCAYGAKVVPCNAVPSGMVERCVGKTIYRLAIREGAPPIYLGEGMLDGVCPGAQTFLGYSPLNPDLKHFISSGRKDVMRGAAEHYKANPELAEESLTAMGTISPIGKFLVVQACEDLPFEDPGVKSILCVGRSEQVRNLCGLVHFGSSDIFGSTVMPWGPMCASFVTYPSGMADKVPGDAAFIGPVEPGGNSWFPEEHLAIAMPISMARRMCDDLERSFIVKKPGTAFPRKRVDLTSSPPSALRKG